MGFFLFVCFCFVFGPHAYLVGLPKLSLSLIHSVDLV